MILITGAGGTIGAELVSRLGREGVPLRAAYRSAARLAEARRAGVRAVALDLEQPGGFGEAFEAVECLFLLCGSHPRQTELELGAVRAARDAGVRRIVKLSVWGAAQESFTYARIHRPVERAIERSGIAWTHLRPNSFMQNLSGFMAGPIRDEGLLRACSSTARISHVDARDVAAAAAGVLTSAGHDGKAYDLSGPRALTWPETAAILAGALGRLVRHEEPPPAARSADLIEITRYYEAGHAAAVTPWVRELTGRDPIPLERFAAEHVAAWGGASL